MNEWMNEQIICCDVYNSETLVSVLLDSLRIMQGYLGQELSGPNLFSERYRKIKIHEFPIIKFSFISFNENSLSPARGTPSPSVNVKSSHIVRLGIAITPEPAHS